MTKAPFQRRRRFAFIAAAGVGGVWRALAAIAALGLLFAFSDVTLYDLMTRPWRSLKWLAEGFGDLLLASFDALPHLLTAAALWLAGAIAWRLLRRNSGTQP
jgi:hypothetical protein